MNGNKELDDLIGGFAFFGAVHFVFYMFLFCCIVWNKIFG